VGGIGTDLRQHSDSHSCASLTSASGKCTKLTDESMKGFL
jgi:hypothetical protein